MINISAQLAPFVTAGFVGAILAVMAFILIQMVRQVRRPEAAPARAEPWSPDYLPGLGLDGRVTHSVSPLRQRVRDTLVVRHKRRTSTVSVGEVVMHSRSIGPYVTGGSIVLRTSQQTVELDFGPYFASPWTALPRFSQLSLRIDGMEAGRLMLSEARIAGLDPKGTEIAAWNTGAWLGSWLRTDEAAKGEDKPVYGTAIVRGRRVGAVRVPRVRLVGRTYDFAGVPIFEDIDMQAPADATPWLLAFAAISAAAALKLDVMPRRKTG